MRNPHGYAVITSPTRWRGNFDHFHCEVIEEGTTEIDTATCNHCNRVVHIKPRMDPADMGGLCKQCMKFICPWCLDKGCTPWEEVMRRQEARTEALRSYGF